MPKVGKRSGLSSGRPPLAQKAKKTLPSKATRSIIRNHHQLHKQLSQAIKAGDTNKAEAIKGQIEEHGGLEAYQSASIIGQSVQRGGDSSKVLMQWLEQYELKGQQDWPVDEEKLKLLEVGALSATNACSRSGIFDVTRIDLNSQDQAIEQQDFMERPLPNSNRNRFDVISLSLVLNYVPDAAGRGDMLRRTREFLRSVDTTSASVFPLLFLVLPAPCLTNSRYIDQRRLSEIMGSLGYTPVEEKISPKLYYSLWQFGRQEYSLTVTFPKVEVNPGRTRNNFCVILR